jgi:ArsR family transcriptional regulator
VEQANLSQHLAVLRARQIVVSRKSATGVLHAARSVLIQVLDLLKQ